MSGIETGTKMPASHVLNRPVTEKTMVTTESQCMQQIVALGEKPRV